MNLTEEQTRYSPHSDLDDDVITMVDVARVTIHYGEVCLKTNPISKP